MASLSDSQRAILQLLLRRAKSYDEIETMLKLEEGAARERAHGAITALGPEQPQIGEARRKELADYLLSQQSDAVRAATLEYLRDSQEGRTWAREVAGELQPIAGDDVPIVPPDPQEDPAPAATPSPPSSTAPAGAASSRTRPGAEGGGMETSTKVLLGVLCLTVVVVLTLALGVFGDDGDKSTTSTVTRTTDTTPANSPQTIAQGNLTDPDGGEATAETGVIRYPATNNFKLLVAAKNLQAPAEGSAYAIWLYTSESEKLFLGFPEATVSDKGELDVVADLTPDTPNFDEVLVTRETSEQPSTPGDIVLRGRLAVATTSQGASPTQTQTQPG